MKALKAVLGTSAVVLGFCLLGGIESDAAVLTANTDLKGYDATITTKSDGTNVLKNKLGEFELNEDSAIYSSKTIKLTLNNSEPVNIEYVYAKKTLELIGKGEMNVSTSGDIGINVGEHFKAFKTTKYGVGKVTSEGAKVGLRVHNEIQMEGGSVEAFGAEYGIYCENDIKPYYSAVLKGTSSEGTGIWAYRDIYAWKGATVVGEGKVSGARSIIAHIQAEDAGSSITGISHNINSSLSALHADKQMLRAYSGAVVREEYKNPGFVITDDVALNLTSSYKTVARNMSNMANYAWSSDPESVYNTSSGLLGDVTKPFSNGTITGVRKDPKTCARKDEVTQLKKNGTHEVIFSGTSSYYIMPVITRHYVNPYSGTEYPLYKEVIHYVEVGQLVKVDDFMIDFGAEAEADYEGADKADFIAVKNGSEVVINYYYKAELD
ncbi:hypothetical protein I6N96_15445 [Enterococcus sp. BWM-S5]|uniref:Uncharacterized protein n=1 Tax=Enterococcus larvae TaxID=2794352 RepID=A0ABS4CN35_9ENTE|nr:hypothetical protein [Enterococcus larvae]MBP1047682.1 hypothetical protein [Enterococcus larvae]